MKLTEEQIWKCNNIINYEGGEVVDAVHICLEHQNVVDFARSIEREIGFSKAELWIKRINDAVLAEREACANTAGLALLGADKALSDRVLKAIRARKPLYTHPPQPDPAQLELNAAIVQTLLPKLYSIIDRLLDGQDKALVIEARRVLPKAYKNSFEKGKGV